MAYQHRNRRGDVYFLQAARTRAGRRRYYFGRKLTDEPIDDVPAGYEVYEAPRYGQVHLRKELLTCITPGEREIVADGVRLFSEVSRFIVDVEEDCLVVYVPTMSENRLNSLVWHLSGPDALQIPRYRAARDQFVRELEHEKALRFQYCGDQQRLFLVERWCSRGADEWCSHEADGGWIYLGGPTLLADLMDNDLLQIHDAIETLQRKDGQTGQLAKLHNFAGLFIEEAAVLLGMSARMAYRDWTYARAWLYRSIHPSGREGSG